MITPVIAGYHASLLPAIPRLAALSGLFPPPPRAARALLLLGPFATLLSFLPPPPRPSPSVPTTFRLDGARTHTLHPEPAVSPRGDSRRRERERERVLSGVHTRGTRRRSVVRNTRQR